MQPRLVADLRRRLGAKKESASFVPTPGSSLLVAPEPGDRWVRYLSLDRSRLFFSRSSGIGPRIGQNSASASRFPLGGSHRGDSIHVIERRLAPPTDAGPDFPTRSPN